MKNKNKKQSKQKRFIWSPKNCSSGDTETQTLAKLSVPRKKGSQGLLKIKQKQKQNEQQQNTRLQKVAQ